MWFDWHLFLGCSEIKTPKEYPLTKVSGLISDITKINMEQLTQKIGLKDWREVIDLDFPKLPEITQKIIQNNIYACRQLGCGDARLATGRIWTDEAYEARRQKVLSTSLP